MRRLDVKDQETLVAWATGKTVLPPHGEPTEHPTYIERTLARILSLVSERLDDLERNAERNERNATARVALLDHPGQVRNHEQRLQRLEENERISNDAEISTDLTTEALNEQTDKAVESLKRAEYFQRYQRQFDAVIAQRNEARVERDVARAERDAAKAELETTKQALAHTEATKQMLARKIKDAT